MRRRQGGFIDPLSLIGLGFLVVSLLVGAVVINKQNANYDIRNKAATCMDPCQTNADCNTNEYCYRPATGCPICKINPTSTPTPTSAPNCSGTCISGVSCVDEGMCGATGSCSGNRHCCEDCQPPPPTMTLTPTPTPTPTTNPATNGVCCPSNNSAGSINTCKGISKTNCENQSVCEWGKNLSWANCPGLQPIPTAAGLCCVKDGLSADKLPSANGTCPGASYSGCSINSSLCEWKLSCSSSTPIPTPKPTSTPTPTTTTTYTCTKTFGQWCSPEGCSAPSGECYGTGSCTPGRSCCKMCPIPIPTPTPTPILTRTPTSRPTATPRPTGTPTPTPTPSCSSAGTSGICSSLICCPGLTKVIGMYGSCQCKVAPTSSPTPIPRCSNFGGCVPVNYICERSYGQLDCRDSQKCGVHCSAPVTPSPTPARTPTTTSTPQCSNLCKADLCCKCTTCDGNTALECSAVCNIQLPSPVPTSTNILQPSSTPTLTPTSTSTPTPSPSSSLGLCEVTGQCPGGYTCLNSYCVNNEEIQQCAINATVLANAAVGSNGITLNASYVPPGLVDMETAVPNAMYASYDEVLIQEDAGSDINCLVDGLAQNGYIPVISYGYRSFELQDQLHEVYGDQAATAGNSQHQTGLAFDIHWYVTENPDGTIEWINAYTDNGLSEPTELAISIAAECGIAHPLGWDAPHFFDVTAACPGLDTFVESVQNPTATYYDELNAMIAQIQQECLEGL